MIDYAISAVGQVSADERLMGAGPSNAALRFETMGSNGNTNIWNTTLNTSEQIRIVQEASSTDAQSKTVLTPWDDFSSQVAEKLDGIQNDWNESSVKLFEKKSFEFQIPESDGLSPRALMQSMLKNFQSVSWNLLKIQRVAGGYQLKIAMVTSLGTTIKNSISALFRQQG